MMKIFLFVAASVLALVVAGVSLAQNTDTAQTLLWSSWIDDISSLWIPFIFALVIVGLGTLAFQRIRQ